MPDPHIRDQTKESLTQALMGAIEAVLSPDGCLVTELDPTSFSVTHYKGDNVLKQFIVRVEHEV
jgi:hypothetical protein